MTNKKSESEKLLDKIIESNEAILNDEKSDAKTKFAAQDRILKVLTLKEKQTKKAGRKFDMGN